jgi:ABC-type lipoprotein release transport system permease subunit
VFTDVGAFEGMDNYRPCAWNDGALIVSHLMAGLFYGVSPSDPLTFISLAVVLVIVALAACYIPAHRAMRVDPIVGLREA